MDQDFQQERSGLGFQCCEIFSRKPWGFLSLRSHLFHDKNWCYWRWINFGVPPPCSRWVVPMTTCSTDTKRHSARTISTSQISNVLSHSWSCRMQKCSKLSCINYFKCKRGSLTQTQQTPTFIGGEAQKLLELPVPGWRRPWLKLSSGPATILTGGKTASCRLNPFQGEMQFYKYWNFELS